MFGGCLFCCLYLQQQNSTTMNYTTLLKDPHNRQVIKAIINSAVNNTVNQADVCGRSGKSVAFVSKLVNTFVNLNQCTVVESVVIDSVIPPLSRIKTEYVFNMGVITDLVAGLKELGHTVNNNF